MARIKLSKNELKKQKDDLRRFERFLPTLDLKKKQLIREVQRVHPEIGRLGQALDRDEQELAGWVALFSESVDWAAILQIGEVSVCWHSVAGVEIPVFEEVVFEVQEPDLFATPLWVDRGLAALKSRIGLLAELKVARQQLEILERELRTVIQRIKLLEEIRIPLARKNIRTIAIAMGDQQIAEIVRTKIAKRKLEARRREQVAA